MLGNTDLSNLSGILGTTTTTTTQGHPTYGCKFIEALPDDMIPVSVPACLCKLLRDMISDFNDLPDAAALGGLDLTDVVHQIVAKCANSHVSSAFICPS
ncbi:hypothetical protein PanWU01x14_200070 [Parasponia andersonii]|uniref:Uncharacterized protein n=1 Tax=Parasponia andersonii TaxID=3476 RepID=A0A2P5BYL3_PARAD|nr:hypothetical protein PanWU01x14_200070 [Parasponia andersonii]